MSIDSLYNNVIEKLTSQRILETMSVNLWKLGRNDARVQLILALLHDLNVVPELLEITKSENVSTYYRNLGNQKFQKHQNYEAWQYYNLSLLHAPTGTDNYALAIANRSAVLYSLKKHKECLIDIDKVFSDTYPEKLKDKLLKRQLQCKDGVLKEMPDVYVVKKEEIDSLLEMRSSPHPIYLSANSKLDVVYSEAMGRHVVATEDIAPGEVIVKENPYFTLLLKSHYLFSCSYCLSRSGNLYPCPTCCFTLYCSTECKEKAWKDYHNVECAIMATLVHMEFTKIELLALRTVIKACSEYHDWENLCKVVTEADSRINTELHGQVEVDGKWVYDSRYYPSIHTLATNVDKRSVSDIFQKGLTAAVFLHLLLKYTNLLNYETEDECKKIVECVSNLLLHHLMTSPTNMHGISSNSEDASGNYVDEESLASAPYAFLSLLNHSCAPNVVRCSKLGTGEITLIALRPIKKGMQLYDNYGSHHALQDRATRQKGLSFQYKFVCTCEACVNDWPTYLNLTTVSNLGMATVQTVKKLLSSDNIEELQKGNLETALKLFKPLCILLSVLEDYAPCMELADCQETLKQCVAILQGIIPYGYTKHVQWKVKPLEV